MLSSVNTKLLVFWRQCAKNGEKMSFFFLISINYYYFNLLFLTLPLGQRNLQTIKKYLYGC